MDVFAVGNTINIKNIAGQNVEIYNILGQHFISDKPSSNFVTYTLPAAGLYVVKVGSFSKKVAVK
ncbi:MAG: T9SS type A sorting domain-containing protein [Bacteroidales bacterium]|nr:T9SS type A sorting domain-containing protein [Bacteroidales bacterium]